MTRIRAVVVRLAVFALLWWLLTEGDGQWTYGIPVVVLLTVATAVLTPPAAARRRPLLVRLRAALRIVVWFLRHSVTGALDVARRAISTPVDVAPTEDEFVVTLESATGRVLLADLAALTPGSLSVDLAETETGHVLHLHLLHTDIDVTAALTDLQRQLSDLLDPPDRKAP